jgi:hypothetical protein
LQVLVGQTEEQHFPLPDGAVWLLGAPLLLVLEVLAEMAAKHLVGALAGMLEQAALA